MRKTPGAFGWHGLRRDEIHTRSALRSLELWQELFARIDEPLFHQTGVLWLAHEDDPYHAKAAETFRNTRRSF